MFIFIFQIFGQISIENAKSSGAKCNTQTFIKTENIFIFGLVEPKTNF
jgi:hypothetical protein